MIRIYLLLLLTIPGLAHADPIHKDPQFDATIAKANALFLDAEFDSGIEVTKQLEKSRQSSPAVSYFLANGYWWKIFRAYIYEKEAKDTPYDHLFEQYLTQTIERSEKRLKKNKTDIEALFYLGNAYSLRSRVKGLRGSYFSAGRDAAKGRDHLERVLQLYPKQYDAFYNIGVYNYLAGTLPGYAKVLKTLLFLPGGSKEKGLNYLKIASKQSTFFGPEAELILARFYADFEDQPFEALKIVKKFHEQYPQNAWYHYWLGTLYSDDINDYSIAENVYTDVIGRCRKGIRSYTKEVETQARLKLARVHNRQLQPEKAIDEIKSLIKEKPTEPSWILARAHMELASIYDQIGMRKEAIQAYNQVLSLPNYRSYHDDARKLRTQKYDQTMADVYRQTLHGRRLARDGKYTEARQSLDSLLKRYPNHELILYYSAEVNYLKQDYQAAETIYKNLLKRNPKEPKWLVGGIHVKLGQINEAKKQPLTAKRFYETALVTKFTASDDRNAARRGLRNLNSH